MLVVLEPHVEQRLVALDQRRFKVQRVLLGAGGDDVQRGDPLGQLARLALQRARRAEVGAHPRAQIGRLADVDHLARRVAEGVDAGLGRQRRHLGDELGSQLFSAHGCKGRANKRKLARPAGLEPAASASAGQRSNPLSYGRTPPVYTPAASTACNPSRASPQFARTPQSPFLRPPPVIPAQAGTTRPRRRHTPQHPDGPPKPLPRRRRTSETKKPREAAPTA